MQKCCGASAHYPRSSWNEGWTYVQVAKFRLSMSRHAQDMLVNFIPYYFKSVTSDNGAGDDKLK